MTKSDLMLSFKRKIAKTGKVPEERTSWKSHNISLIMKYQEETPANLRDCRNV